jgi:hypothetical protein
MRARHRAYVALSVAVILAFLSGMTALEHHAGGWTSAFISVVTLLFLATMGMVAVQDPGGDD